VAADPIKDKPVENIFRITDEIVQQLNKTKKMIILMIVSIVIVLPATHIISFALIGDMAWHLMLVMKAGRHGLTALMMAALQTVILHLE
jgi:hypothetical protein